MFYFGPNWPNFGTTDTTASKSADPLTPIFGNYQNLFFLCREQKNKSICKTTLNRERCRPLPPATHSTQAAIESFRGISGKHSEIKECRLMLRPENNPLVLYKHISQSGAEGTTGRGRPSVRCTISSTLDQK